MNQTPLDFLIEKYYPDILRYCTVKLNHDTYGAEDCTQEVFCLLAKKAGNVDITKDLRPWLYAVADRIILHHKHKNPETVPIEEVSEDRLVTDFPYNDMLLSLEENERKLLIAYFSGADKAKLAAEYGISVSVLYKRIARLKEKLLKNLGKSD